MLVSCRIDLDSQLHFADKTIILTDVRLLADQPAWHSQSPSLTLHKETFSWRLAPSHSLDVRLRGSLGRIELFDSERVIARWFFTAACGSSVHVLENVFDQRSHSTAHAKDVSASTSDFTSTKEAADHLDLATPETSISALRALLRVLAFARPHAPIALLGCLLSFASTAASLVPPYLTMPLVDRVLIPKQLGQDIPFTLVWWYLGGLAIASVVAWLLSWAQSWTLAWVSERLAASLRVRTYAHMQRLSLDFYSEKRTGDLMSRIGSDTDRINDFVSLHLIDFISNMMLIVLAAFVLVSISPPLAIVTLAPFPLFVWLIYSVRKKLRRGFNQLNAAWADMTSILADTIPGIRVVKAFAQEQREIERFQEANDQILETSDRVNVVWAFFGPLVSLLSEAGLLIVWASGAWLVFGGSVTVGALSAFLAYIARFYGRIESMIRMVPATQQAAASAQRIFEILDRKSSVAEAVNPIDPGRVRGCIELSGVHFRYGSREVLHGIDLLIQPGEMIGLVGSSGSGKSTLANLICRFYDASSGSITIDGIDVRQLSIEAYRRNLGVVLQEPFLFFGSVAENIAYGKPEATHNEIVAASRAAGAHEFILNLQSGYDSRVGERGSSLSGGERQRISIARALLIDPSILLLDEATSSVDAETEIIIQSAIDTLVTGRTTLAIAHRLSTLRRADRLVVLDSGRIVEIGTHDELLSVGGFYARLYHAQNTPAVETDSFSRGDADS